MMPEIILTSTTKSELKGLIAETLKEELSMFFKKSNEPNNRMLTRKEVAKTLGISLVTLNSYTKEGIIPAVRIGSNVRYRSSEIESAMQDIRSIRYSRGQTIKNVQL